MVPFAPPVFDFAQNVPASCLHPPHHKSPIRRHVGTGAYLHHGCITSRPYKHERCERRCPEWHRRPLRHMLVQALNTRKPQGPSRLKSTGTYHPRRTMMGMQGFSCRHSTLRAEVSSQAAPEVQALRQCWSGIPYPVEVDEVGAGNDLRARGHVVLVVCWRKGRSLLGGNWAAGGCESSGALMIQCAYTPRLPPTHNAAHHPTTLQGG
jgi:hypothetical protein